MSSHCREQGGPALQLYSPLPYSYPCTPQAHYRSDTLSFPLDSMESWFRALSGVETRDGTDVQQSSEKTIGVTVTEDANMENVFHLGDFQSETWWPPIGSQAQAEDVTPLPSILKQDQRGSDDGPGSGVAAFAQELSRDQVQGFHMQSWCHQPNAPLALAIDNGVPEAPAALRPPMATSFTGPSSFVEPPSVTRVQGSGDDQFKGISISAPATPSEWRAPKEKKLCVQKKGTGKRPVSQRESHIWSERERRKGMNHLFSTLRSLLPHPSSKTDKATVISEIIKYIQSLQQKLEILTKKRQQMMAARTLILPFHTCDSSATTTLAALPPPGSESCLQSYLGANVALHVCGLNVFITISSPRGRRGIFQRILVTIHAHQLDVINANISTSNTSIFHFLHCQATQGAEKLKNTLHTALQSLVNSFELSP